MFRQQNNLPHVMRVVRELTVDRLHHRVRLSANRDPAFEIGIGQRLDRAKHTIPAVFPFGQ